MAFDREGVFNAKPVDWGLNPSKTSQACALNIQWRPYEVLDDGLKKFVEFDNPEGLTVYSNTWFIKKDGSINELTVQRTMVDTLKWSGEISDFDDIEKFKPPDCQIEVEKDEYKDKLRYVVSWVNPLGGGEYKPARADSSALADISDKFGDNIKRAMKGEKQTPPPDDDIPF